MRSLRYVAEDCWLTVRDVTKLAFMSQTNNFAGDYGTPYEPDFQWALDAKRLQCRNRGKSMNIRVAARGVAQFRISSVRFSAARQGVPLASRQARRTSVVGQVSALAENRRS